MKDEYQSIKAGVTASIKIEASKFIATAHPVELRSQAEETLARVRKEYFDATHHCYAYILGSEGKEFRYSDDGEPSGTAGTKILAAIQSKNLSDVLVVVTRYFGGTKLGTGGLARAYVDSASRVLSDAVIVPKIVIGELLITFPYDETSRVMNTLSQRKGRIIDTVYGDDVTLRITIRKSSMQLLADELVNVTRGNLAVKYGGK
ncbi:MAG: YigZ family protein [Bacteroidota bacterium]